MPTFDKSVIIEYARELGKTAKQSIKKAIKQKVFRSYLFAFLFSCFID